MTTPQQLTDLIASTTTQAPNSPNVLNRDWQLTAATITTAGVSRVGGILDGDGVLGDVSTPIPLMSLVGYVPVGARVMVLYVPSAGYYVISALSGSAGTILTSENSVRASADTQGIVSGSFTDITSGGGAPVAFTFRKDFTQTRIAIHYHMSAYTTASIGTAIDCAVNINGTDYNTAYLFYNVINSHMAFSSTTHVPAGIPAGEYTITARWRRAAGGGGINMDSNDLITILAREAV